MTSVWIKEKGYDIPVDEICPLQYRDMVDGRVFETLKDMNITMMVLGTSRWGIEHGLGCPRDVKKAIEKVQGLPLYK